MEREIPENLSLIELDIATLFMKDGMIYIIYKDVVIDGENVKEVIWKRIEMAGGISRPILVDARKVKYWTIESKKFSFSKDAILYMSAVAVVNQSVIGSININFSLNFFKPAFPLKYFSDIKKAEKWLQGFK